MLFSFAFFIFYIIMILITSKSIIYSDYGNRIQHEILLANDKSSKSGYQQLMEFTVVVSILWYFYWSMYLLDKYIDYRINKNKRKNKNE